MKKIYILICVVICADTLIAQTNTFPSTGNAGIGTTTPNASSLLDIGSTSKGLLLPRMTKSQRDAIVSPVTGLLIFQTNSTPGFYYFSGTSWKAISTKDANTSLSNLSTDGTSINLSLTPQSNNIFDLGNAELKWKNVYLTKIYFNDGSFISSAPVLYTAGIGINITGNIISNSGDVNGVDDILNTTNSGGDVTGTFSNLQLKENSVLSNEIATGAVGTDEILNNTIAAIDLATMGATTNQLLRYSGTAWAPATSTLSLDLPYTNFASSAGNLLSLTNTGTGVAFHGKTTSTVVPAIYGENINEDAIGIYGISNTGLSSKGVHGYVPEGYGIEGSNEDGVGILAIATGTGYGLYGLAISAGFSGGYFSSMNGPALVIDDGNVGIDTIAIPASKLMVNNKTLLKSVEVVNKKESSESITAVNIDCFDSYINKLTGIYCSVVNSNTGATGDMVGVNILTEDYSTDENVNYGYGLHISKGNSLDLVNSNYIGLYSIIHSDLFAEPGPDDWAGRFIGDVLLFNSPVFTHSIGRKNYSSFIDTSNFGLNVFETEGKCAVITGYDTTSILLKSTTGYFNDYLYTWVYTHKKYDISLIKGHLNFNSESTILPFEINNSDSMLLQINNYGVTISKDSIPVPEGYVLAVDGKIIAENISIRLSTTWPDYVFDDNYNLIKRVDLEKYVIENKHLPNVLSSAEINENGFEIGEMQKQLLQKIEELTLYIIEDQNKLDILNQETETLKNKIQQ